MTEPKKTLTDLFSDEAQFMEAGLQTVGEFNIEQKILYERLIREEFTEMMDAINDGEPLANQIKEANDLLVVTINWLHSVIPNAHKSWRLVYANNMLKVVNPPVKDPVTGKIQKSSEAVAGKVVMMTGIDALIDPEPPELI